MAPQASSTGRAADRPRPRNLTDPVVDGIGNAFDFHHDSHARQNQIAVGRRNDIDMSQHSRIIKPAGSTGSSDALQGIAHDNPFSGKQSGSAGKPQNRTTEGRKTGRYED